MPVEQLSSKQYPVQFHQDPKVELLHEIANFIHTETQNTDPWDTTSEYISRTKSVIGTIKDDTKNLIAAASLSFLNSSNAWLGSVIVSRAHRRKRIGTILVSQMLQYAAHNSPAKTVSLVTSVPALYSSMSFQVIPDINVMYYTVDSGPFTATRTPYTVATAKQRESAAKVYTSITGMCRDAELENIVKTGGKCVVIEKDHQIVAAGWGQRMAPTVGPPPFFIAPLVARSPDFAMQACTRLMEIEKHERAIENIHTAPFLSRALVLKKGPSLESVNAFKALGFKYSHELPYMAKCVHDHHKLDQNSLDLPRAGLGYFALLGFELG